VTEDDHVEPVQPGPRFLSPWAFLRASVVFCVAADGTLVAGETEDGRHMWTCFTDARAAEAACPSGFGLRRAPAFDMVARLPAGSGVWVDPGSPAWTTLTPETVDLLRPHATLLPTGPTGPSVLWEDFPRFDGAKELASALRKWAKQTELVHVIWLLGFQVEDAPPEGVVVLAGEGDPGTAMTGVFGVLDETLAAIPGEVSGVQVVTLSALPPEAQELVRQRQPLHSRAGRPKLRPHARTTVDHLATVVVLEEARGNSVASAEGALLDGRPAVVMKHPLDIDALALELALTDGHTIESFGDRWAVTCSHGGPAVLGGTTEPGRMASSMRRRWWKRWNKKPREQLVV
jgi:hypothetical protein